jgi:hypothetical protein
MSRASDLANLIASGSTTIFGEAGVTSSDSTGKTTNLQQGLAKSWVNYNGSGTIAVRDSLNVTSLNDTGSGRHEYNFTNNMNNTEYTHIAGAGTANYSTSTFVGVRTYGVTPSTSQCGNNVMLASTDFGTYDAAHIASSNHGDLA